MTDSPTAPRDGLQPLPEDFDRALAIVAHPDDLEYGTAAAVRRWTLEGKSVGYLLATRGEAGIDTMHPHEAQELRAQEERDAAALVGVQDVHFLDYPDGLVTYSVDLRRDIARVIRTARPQVVLAMAADVLMPWGLNQADHRAVGLVAIDACRDAGNRWVHRDLLDVEGLQPWSPTDLLVFATTDPTHYVDVTGHLDAAVASLAAHAVYNNALTGDLADAGLVVERTLTAGGRAVTEPAVEHAVLFTRYAV